MRPEWYADKRDLVKWSVLYYIAVEAKADLILQVAYLRKSEFGKISIDGKEKDIPVSVLSRFRNLSNIAELNFECKIDVFDKEFNNRKVYLNALLNKIDCQKGKRKVVFLDPDTGLEPKKTKPGLEHVLNEEIQSIYNALEMQDVLVLYQHRTNRSGKPWIPDKRDQLTKALGVSKTQVKVADSFKIANDVVLFYVQKL